jgi:tRNA(Ile)-lysidine synthase
MGATRAGTDLPRFLRPLLPYPRTDIAAYAVARSLRWIEDESNADVRHRRNFLRSEILPKLASGFPGYRAALARAANNAADVAELLDELARFDAASALRANGLSVAELRRLGASRSRNLVRWHCRQLGLDEPGADRLAEFVRQVAQAAPDRHPKLEVGAGALHSDGRTVSWLAGSTIDRYELRWRGETTLRLPHGELTFTASIGAGIRREGLPSNGLTVRPRQGGERARLAPGRPSRSLKNLFQEAGIPAPLRSGWPLLADGHELVAVPGVGVDTLWQCAPGDPGWTVAWRPNLPPGAAEV